MTTLDELRAYDTAEAIPYALRTYTTEQIGGNRVDVRRHADGPDALPVGERQIRRAGVRGVSLIEAEFVPYVQARELYLTRTQSHLYEDDYVESTIELWQIVAKRDGHLLADCHRCRMTHGVAPDTDNCPTCGTEF